MLLIFRLFESVLLGLFIEIFNHVFNVKRSTMAAPRSNEDT